MTPEPFTLHVPDEVLDDLRVRLERTRWPEVADADPSQLEAARAAIEEAGRRLVSDPAVGPSVIEPPQLMFVSDITDAGIRLLIWGRVRAAERFAVEGEFRRLLLEALREAGVELVAEQRVRLSTRHRAARRDVPAPSVRDHGVPLERIVAGGADARQSVRGHQYPNDERLDRWRAMTPTRGRSVVGSGCSGRRPKEEPAWRSSCSG
jgi:hypothetical protein